MVRATKPVLLVDDDPDILEVMRMILESRGHAVVVSTNGTRALDVLASGAVPGVILLDLMMPEMNGWEFRRAVAANPQWASIPIVVVTGDGRAADKADEMGAAGYLRKPVDLDELVETVDRFGA